VQSCSSFVRLYVQKGRFVSSALDMVRPRPVSGPVHLLIDSTGLKLCGAGEWLLEKHGTKTHRSWRKLHIAVDADTGQIAAAVLTTSDVDDASQVGILLDQVEGPVASFTADGAYDQDGVYREVTARHPEASVIVPPRSSAVPSDTAETAPPLLFQPLRGWNLEQLRRPCETGTCRSLPSVAAWPGRRFRAVTGVPWWRQTSVASNGLSVMGGAGQGSACAARGIPAEGTVTHRSALSDRSCHCRGRTEPNARTRAPRVRPPRVTANQNGRAAYARVPD